MSVSRNFRVAINLSNFFNDHRHTVRIFVNDDIETIKDLQRKISNIFGLRDFYLVCQNVYLPPSEDVRILQKDEMLWVMPEKLENYMEHNLVFATGASTIKPCKTTKRSISPLEECVEEESSRPKKKKRKHSKEKEALSIKNLSTVLHSHINSYNKRNDNTSKVDKEIDDKKDVVCKGNLQNYKKKVPLSTITQDYLEKKKVNIVKINYVLGSPGSSKETKKCHVKEPLIEKSTINGNMTSTETSSYSILKNTTHIPQVEKVDTMNDEKMENISDQNKIKLEVDESKHSDVSAQINNITISPIVPNSSFEVSEETKINTTNRRTLFFLPQYCSEITSISESQESIDKSSHSILENTTHIPRVEKAAIIDESKLNDVSAQIDNISPIVPKYHVEVSEETKINTKNNWDTFSTEISMDNSPSQHSGFLKLNASTSCRSKIKELSGIGNLLQDLRSSDSCSYKTMADNFTEFVPTKRRRHRKRASKKNSSYAEDSVIMIEPSSSKPINAKANPTIHLKFVEDEQSDDVVAVDVKDRRDESKLQPISNIEMSKVDDNVENFEIKEENIKKYPLMDGLSPKIGNVVIFKKLKLTDNYCPIVSSWIAGRVQAFDPVTKYVTLDIVVGLDQCEEPKGNLSIDSDNNQPEQSTVRDVLWEGIIEPRLIYP